jgi:hypothetical protein
MLSNAGAYTLVEHLSLLLLFASCVGDLPLDSLYVLLLITFMMMMMTLMVGLAGHSK